MNCWGTCDRCGATVTVYVMLINTERAPGSMVESWCLPCVTQRATEDAS